MADFSESRLNAELASMTPPRGPITPAQKALVVGFFTNRFGPASLLTTGPVGPNLKAGVALAQSTSNNFDWTISLSSSDPAHMDQAPANFLTIADKIRVLYWREVP